jgi:hypothetical protein
VKREKKRSYDDFSPSDLEARIAEMDRACEASEAAERDLALGQKALLEGQVKLREARGILGKAPDRGSLASKFQVVLRVSEVMHTRMQSLARREGRLLQDIFFDAISREVDRLERKAMVEVSAEGREALAKYRKGRRRP